jgi:hypothetical protein
MSVFSRLAAAGLLASFVSIAPVHAQDTTPSNTPAATTTDTGTVRYDERRGFDWGWLGLLGLFGLMGLRRASNVYRDRDRTYQDRTTTR